MSEPLLIQGQVGDVILLFDKFDPVQHVLRKPVQIGALVHVAVLDQQSPSASRTKVDQQQQLMLGVIDLALDIIDHMIALV